MVAVGVCLMLVGYDRLMILRKIQTNTSNSFPYRVHWVILVFSRK